MGALEARLIKYFCHEHAIIIEKRCTSVSMRCRLFDRFVRFGTSAPTVLLVAFPALSWIVSHSLSCTEHGT